MKKVILSNPPQHFIVHWKNTQDNYLARKYCDSYSEATLFAAKLNSRKHIANIAINVYQVQKVITREQIKKEFQ